MKTISITTSTVRNLIAASLAGLAFAAATPAEARDRHHSCYSGYKTPYTNYGYSHGSRGATYSYPDRYHYQRPVVVYRPSYSSYSRNPCISTRPGFSISIGGFRIHR
ncbi:MAG: hypothetical protein ABMA13_04505 [Chthoniobacteraceae bacterium]